MPLKDTRDQREFLAARVGDSSANLLIAKLAFPLADNLFFYCELWEQSRPISFQ